MAPASRGRSWGFPGLFILMGAIALVLGVRTLVRSLACESWPTTDGVVEQAAMESHSSDDGGDTYSAVITYRYEVAGRHYEGKRLAIGAMSSSDTYAQRILSRYPAGKTITVHYSAEAPEQAVLETGIHGGTWIFLVVGTVFILAGIMMGQLFGKAASAIAPAKTTPGPPAVPPPPLLLGVIIMVMGSSAFFAEPSSGTPRWVVWAAGGAFVLIGLFILASRFENKIYSNLLKTAAVLAFLAVVHWVSFGAGERTGTSITPFAQHTGVNLKPVFAGFTILMDLVLLASLVHWLGKKRKG